MATEFSMNWQDLDKIVEATRTRTHAEELEEIERYGGIESIAKSLQTDMKYGLNTEDEAFLEKRKQAFGTNIKEETPPVGFLALCWEALKDFTMRILLLCAVVSLILGLTVDDDPSHGWIDGAAIMVAVALVTLVTAFNDYSKDRKFRKLNEVSDEKRRITVRRNGELHVVHISELLVGDIARFTDGQDIAADALMFDARDLLSNESALTGEPDDIRKGGVNDCLERKAQVELDDDFKKDTPDAHAVPSPILLSGTSVVGGEGWGIIVAVGSRSVLGKIFSLIEQESPQTPLQLKLEKIASDIGKAGLAAAILSLSVLFLRYFIEGAINDDFETEDITELLGYLIIAITIVVVAIPEGLPLAVTISLAYSVQKMLNDQNLVRRLQSCETMGGANAICSDKTGTLTMNKMTLTKLWFGSLMDVERNIPKQDAFHPEVYEKIVGSITCNSTAEILEKKWSGNVTEIALLQFMQAMGEDYDKRRNAHLPSGFHRFTFSSRRKRMSTVLENVANAPTGRQLHVKGAAEMILASCTHYFDNEGNKIPLTKEVRDSISQIIEKMASEALRTIMLAYKDIEPGAENDAQKDDKGVAEIEKEGLTCIAICGIKDIVRPEVPGAVRRCQMAGIKVRMVTGDNKLTATAIAKECNILQGGIVMEGSEFMDRIGGVISKNIEVDDDEDDGGDNKGSDGGSKKKKIKVDTIKNKEAFDQIVPRLDVLARSRPEDKYALVLGLIERGDVVAVTGDGTNDAPALKKADVGFAMGITGTEVAKEAADITLLDDNFTSIVKAVKWGRNIYDNIRRFLQFQLTVNVVAVSLAVIGAFTIKQSPLTAVQMLWVNLIMDTFASLALATEPPTDGLLDRLPHNRDEYIVSKRMMKHILGQSVYQLIVCIILVYAGDQFIPEDDDQPRNGTSDYVRSGRYYHFDGEEDWGEDAISNHGYSRHLTVLFNTFVLMQLFNEINARKIHDEMNVFAGITRNALFYGIWFGTFIVQIIMVQFGGRPLNCASDGLNFMQWVISVLFGLGSLPTGVILKTFMKIEDPKPKKPVESTGSGRKASDKRSSERKSSNVLSLRKGSAHGNLPSFQKTNTLRQ